MYFDDDGDGDAACVVLHQPEEEDALLKRVLPKYGDQCIFAFGRGSHGRLGINSTHNTVCPMPIMHPEFQKHKIKKISAGNAHFLVLLDNGQVYACGHNASGQVRCHSHVHE